MPVTPINIQGNAYSAEVNPSLTKNGNVKSRFDHVTTWLKDVGGAVNAYQTLEKTLKLASLYFRSVGSKTSIFCDRLAGKVSAVYSGLCLTRLPDTVNKAFQAIFYPKAKLTSRDHVDAIYTLADAGMTVGYSGAFLGGGIPFLGAAEGFSLATTMSDAYMKGYDVRQVNKLLPHVGSSDEAKPVRKMLEDTKTHAYLKIAKAVASLAMTALGCILLAAGGPAIPAVALIGVGLAATIVGIAAYFFKETAPYELADFSKKPNSYVPVTV